MGWNRAKNSFEDLHVRPSKVNNIHKYLGSASTATPSSLHNLNQKYANVDTPQLLHAHLRKSANSTLGSCFNAGASWNCRSAGVAASC